MLKDIGKVVSVQLHVLVGIIGQCDAHLIIYEQNNETSCLDHLILHP